MRFARLSATLSLFLALGCTSSLEADPESEIACASDNDCPEGWTCRDGVGRCLLLGADEPLAPQIGQIQVATGDFRSLNTGTLTIELSDPNALAGETLAVSLELSTDGGSSWSAARSTPTDILVNAEPTPYTLEWLALEDAQDGIAGILAEQVDSSGDGTTDTQFVDYVPTIQFRVRAEDPSGLSTLSSASSSIEFGNRPPEAVLGSAPELDELRDLVAIEFTMDDPALDLISAEFQFRETSDGMWRRMAIVQGTTEQLIANPDLRYVVVWDSRAAASPLAETPQGVGDAVAQVEIRVRGFEQVADDGQHFGPWSSPQTLPILRNQTPP
ncbi:MAG: hypothetical protein AAFQ82_25590, partial [Myxococcota bacterium]